MREALDLGHLNTLNCNRELLYFLILVIQEDDYNRDNCSILSDEVMLEIEQLTENEGIYYCACTIVFIYN